MPPSPRFPSSVPATGPVAIVCLFVLVSVQRAPAADWKPADGPLRTRWAKEVTPDNALPEYPRPQMVRTQWQNLNGLWDYAIRPKDEDRPEDFDGRILVPFPVESALSGVQKRVGADNRLWYRRTFATPAAWKEERVLLHFGAVDWEATVRVNGREVGTHRGGYDPFTFDVTGALRWDGENELVVSVWDPTNRGHQPVGKQHENPHGIWYTPVTGIWQTVWLEPVPRAHISGLHVVPDLDRNQVRVTVATDGCDDKCSIKAVVQTRPHDLTEVEGRPNRELVVPIPDARLWTPDNPHLYNLTVQLEHAAARTQDVVTGYFGMRKIALGKGEDGVTRLFLNNEPVFQYGLLDQGFWPDGLYTAPTDEALRYDIEVTKRLGFNMARKHVKVEPARWYYWCDRLGLLVWQDMPNGDAHVGPGRGEITRSPESAENFERELKAVIDALRNHPSIVTWVPFNEGWGQYDTVRITNWVKEYDPTRLAVCASGWNDFPVGDAHDIHSYPGPASPQPEEARAAVLGEFGGLGLPLRGHTWQDEQNWGYRSYTTPDALTDAYLNLVASLRPLIRSPGLSAAVYTQTTDVEIEVNGVMSYDREVIKMPVETVAAANRKLYLPPPRIETVVSTAHDKGHEWAYTFERPGDGWHRPDFDDSGWKRGPAGFGTRGTPGAVVRTEWNTPEIWIRRTVELRDRELAEPHLLLHHDEDAHVYINGVLAAEVTGYTVDYRHYSLRSEARAALQPGPNTIAIHCRQTGGGQYIDVGIVDVIEQSQ